MISVPDNFIKGPYATDYLVRLDAKIVPPESRFPMSLLRRRFVKLELLPLTPDGFVDKPQSYHLDNYGRLRRRGRFLTGLFNGRLGYLKGNRGSIDDEFADFIAPTPDPEAKKQPVTL